MATKTALDLMTSEQALLAYPVLAALGAGLLFLLEGALLGILAFAGNQNPDSASGSRTGKIGPRQRSEIK